MASANIVIRQSDSNQISISRDDLVLNMPVTLLNLDDSGVVSWIWQLIDKPIGSTASLSSSIIASPTFIPDIEGTYLIKLTVNSGIATDQKGAAVKTVNLHYRIPAASEEGEFDPVRGWANAVNNALHVLDDGYGDLLNQGSGSGSVTSITATSPLTGGTIITTGNIGIDKADATHDGYLSQQDWTAFNNKIGGTGVNNQVVVWNGTSSLSSSSSFTFDNSYLNVGESGNHITSIFYGDVGILSNIDTFGPSGMTIGTNNATSIVIGSVNANTTVDGYLAIPQTSSLFFNGLGDFNWRMGINLPGDVVNPFAGSGYNSDTAAYAKINVGSQLDSPGNTIDIIVGSGPADGFTIGNTNGNSVLEINNNGVLFIGPQNNDGTLDINDLNGHDLVLGGIHAQNIKFGTTAIAHHRLYLGTSLYYGEPGNQDIPIDFNTSSNGYVLTFNGGSWSAAQIPASTDTLQNIYDNSSDGTIVVNNSLGPLVVRNDGNNNNSWFNQLFAVQKSNQARIFAIQDTGSFQTLSANLELSIRASGGSGATITTLNGALTITDDSSPVGTLFDIVGNGGSPTYFAVSPTQTTINHAVVDGFAIDISGGAINGDALVYNGTAFVPTAGGGGGLGGSIANNQVAFGSGTSITGSNNLQYDGTNLALSSGNLYIDNNHYIDFFGNDIFWQIGRNISSAGSHPYTKTLLNGQNTLDILLPGDGEGFTIGAGSGPQTSVLEVQDTGDIYMSGRLGIGTTPAHTFDLTGSMQVIGNALFDGTITIDNSHSIDSNGTLHIATNSNALDVTIGSSNASAVIPGTNNTINLGSNSNQWHDGYFGGNVNVAGYAIDISGGAVNGQALIYDGTAFVPTNVGSSNLLVVTSIKTSNYTAADYDLVQCNPSSGGFAITLPTASGHHTLVIKNITNSTNTITITPNGADTIDGASSKTITNGYEAMTLYSDGSTNWIII